MSGFRAGGCCRGEQWARWGPSQGCGEQRWDLSLLSLLLCLPGHWVKLRGGLLHPTVPKQGRLCGDSTTKWRCGLGQVATLSELRSHL